MLNNLKKSFAFLLAICTMLTGIQVFGATSLPSISSKKPLVCYTINSSGKVYAYEDKNLKTKTGGYISCSTDECKIIEISGNAVKVTYPIDSGGTKTKWFSRDAFTAANIANGASSKFTQSKQITTYKRSDGKASFGYVSAGDACYILKEKGNYTQLIYPISGGYKMAWVKTSAISKKGNDNSKSDSKKSDNSSSKSLADVANNEVGYQGTGKNGKGKGDYTKYGVFTNANGQAWCASFVSWCANKAGISTKVIPKKASCNAMKNSNSYKKWSSSALKNIKKNDVVLFSSNGSQDSHHIGIVYSISGSKITTIEGNTSSDVVAKRNYAVNSSNGKTSGTGSTQYICGYISVK